MVKEREGIPYSQGGNRDILSDGLRKCSGQILRACLKNKWAVKYISAHSEKLRRSPNGKFGLLRPDFLKG